MDKEDFDDTIFPHMVASVIGASMATYIVVEGQTGAWQDWMRAKIVAHSENDPEELRKMYQVIANAPADVIEGAVEMFVRKLREEAKMMSEISKGLPSWPMGPQGR